MCAGALVRAPAEERLAAGLPARVRARGLVSNNFMLSDEVPKGTGRIISCENFAQFARQFHEIMKRNLPGLRTKLWLRPRAIRLGGKRAWAVPVDLRRGNGGE